MCYNDFNEKCVKEFCIFSAIIKIFRGVFGASQTPGLISAIRKKQASLIFNYFASMICLPSLVTFHVVFFFYRVSFMPTTCLQAISVYLTRCSTINPILVKTAVCYLR